MSINVSRDFATELLKDIVYPEVCPVCGDAIPTAKRIAYHRAMAARTNGNSAVHDTRRDILTRSCKPSAYSDYAAQDFTAYYGGLVCKSCLEALEYVSFPYCSKCGKPLSRHAGDKGFTENASADVGKALNVSSSVLKLTKLPKTGDPNNINIINGSAEETTLLCEDCRTHERSFVQNRALLKYDERMRDIMADIKYNGKKEYLRLFGVIAADRLGPWIRENGINCLVPVPVHSSRLKKRGYNQSELLCDCISGLTGIPVRRDVIIRNKKTAAQKELNVDERLLNLQSAFTATGHMSGHSKALIVDDIYTTGSTMEACTECLAAAGAGAVYGLTVCIGEDNGA